MKRFYKLLGITALVAVIAIGLAGCPNEPGEDDDIRISTLISKSIYIDVGEGLSHISAMDSTVQNALKANFAVTVNDVPANVTGVSSVGSIVNGVSFMDLVVTIDTAIIEGTSYVIKVKYTKGTTSINFDNGSELGNFEIEGTVKAE
jgi:hypothetical protein